MSQPSPFGMQLRYWRRSRGLSQLDLAHRASSTPRYVSFLENGRSRPSEQMVHRVAEALDVPVRERNGLLEAAGFAGKYSVRDLAEPEMAPYREALRYVLRAHEPFPAIVVNRWWDVVDANQAARHFMFRIDSQRRPTNMVEWLFQPSTELRQRLVQWEESAYAFLRRIRRELTWAPGDERLRTLVAYAEGQLQGVEPPDVRPSEELSVCPGVRIDGMTVRMVSTLARFGSAREVTLDEVRVECLYPRDDESEAFFRGQASEPPLRVAH